MANKIKVKLILELRDAHISQNSIAATRNMSKSSVSEVCKYVRPLMKNRSAMRI